MGSFGDIGGKFATSSGDYELAEDGIYLCKLAEVEPIKQPSFDDPAIEEDKFKFLFEALEETDSQGRPYRFVKFTGRAYGNEKANLTALIDGMMGRHLTQEEFANLDLDNLMAKKYRVNVELTQSKTGKDINKILWVKTPKAAGEKKGLATAGAGSRKMPNDPTDSEDPFEE
jgi:hypothetical protein